MESAASIDTAKMMSTINDPNLEKVYFNGFTNALGAGDIIITLYLNGTPTKVLNLSYTVAKTLCQKLSETVDQLEKQSGISILTTDDVAKALSPTPH